MKQIVLHKNDDDLYQFTTEGHRTIGPFASEHIAKRFIKRFIGPKVEIVSSFKPMVFQKDDMWWWTDGSKRGPFLSEDMAISDLKSILQNNYDDIMVVQ